MSVFELILGLVNLFLISGFLILWNKLKTLSGDEGRLSQGLQLLQMKLAVLEDLSNKVEEQVQHAQRFFENKKSQMTELLDLMEEKIHILNEKSALIMENSEELTDRELTVKLTRAAILAHKGVPAPEIAKRLGLGLQEAELIASLNSQTLQFEVDSLPKWLKERLQLEELL